MRIQNGRGREKDLSDSSNQGRITKQHGHCDEPEKRDRGNWTIMEGGLVVFFKSLHYKMKI